VPRLGGPSLCHLCIRSLRKDQLSCKNDCDRPHTCKAIGSIVGQSYGIFFRLESSHCQDGTKDLFPPDRAVVCWVQEQSWLDKTSLTSHSSSSSQQLSTLFTLFNVRHYPIELQFVGDRTVLSRHLRGIAAHARSSVLEDFLDLAAEFVRNTLMYQQSRCSCRIISTESDQDQVLTYQRRSARCSSESRHQH